METARRVVASLLLVACNRGELTPVDPSNVEDPARADAPRAIDEPMATMHGPAECGSHEECHAQAPAHGTWCGPAEQDFTGRSVVEPYTGLGTLDVPYWTGATEPGCRCIQGRCGALLNDGRLVIGPQPQFVPTAETMK